MLLAAARVAAMPFLRFPALVAGVAAMLALPPLLTMAVLAVSLKKIFIMALCQGVAAGYLAGWVAVAMRGRRWVLLAMASGAALLSLVCGLFVIMSSRTFATETLVLVLQTDAREAGSFVRQFVTPARIAGAAGYLLLLVAMVWLSVWRGGSAWLLRSRRVACVLCALGLSAAAVGFVRLAGLARIFTFSDLAEFEQWYSRESTVAPGLYRLAEWNNGDALSCQLFAWRGLWLNTRELPRWEAVQRQVIGRRVPHAAEADSVNIVVVIGESFIKRHSSLYGYCLATNPRLQAEADSGRLAVFTDWISPANFTAAALRNLLNLNDLSAGERWNESPYFPLVAALGGWRVHLYDNQLTVPEFLVDVQLSAIMRNKLLDGVCYQWASDTLDRYDGDFVARVNRTWPFDGSVGNLDIFHLYGQHFAPADRYPATGGHDRWTGDSLPYDRPWFTPAKRQTVAEYDNATLYNDSVVGAIIDRYRHTPTVLIYFSDHGEEMYDASDCAVRNEPSGDLAGWLERQFEIPFFVWASDSYREMRPEQWQAVCDAVDRRGMLDNLGQMVLGLGGLDGSGYYRPTRDLLNRGYEPRRRVTLSHQLDYDSLRRGGRRP